MNDINPFDREACQLTKLEIQQFRDIVGDNTYIDVQYSVGVRLAGVESPCSTTYCDQIQRAMRAAWKAVS
jgi:hypothetical protein